MSLVRDAIRRAQLEREARGGAAPAVAPAMTPPLPIPASRDLGRLLLERVSLEVDSRVVAWTSPGSSEAQQYANLRAGIVLGLGAEPSRVVVVTSAVAHEGKTLTAVNLAVCAAQFDRAVVVDADLHTPSVHELLATPRSPGLADYLRGRVSLDEAIRPTPIDRLSLMPAGRAGDSASHLLMSGRLRQLLDGLRERFDDVIIDCGPVLAVTDGRTLAAGGAGVLMVVRAGHTRREVVQEALQRLAPVRVLGLVLNQAARTELEPYYGNVGAGRPARP